MTKDELLLKENIDKQLIKIGVNLKSLRKAKGYTSPDKFAYDHNLNRSQYGKYEAGRTNLTIGTLMGILKHFGLTLEEFFKYDSTE